MTFEEAKKIFLNRGYVEVSGGTYYDADKWRESIAVISEWLEQQPCEDAVSRRRIFSAIHNTHLPKKYEEPLWNKVSDLPPVTPKEKTGHWIDITNKNGTVIAVRCDCCGNSPKHAIISDFCPNCGCRMRGDTDA